MTLKKRGGGEGELINLKMVSHHASGLHTFLHFILFDFIFFGDESPPKRFARKSIKTPQKQGEKGGKRERERERERKLVR